VYRAPTHGGRGAAAAEEAEQAPREPALLLSIGGTGCVFLGRSGATGWIALAIVAIALELRAPERHAGGGSAMAAILIGASGVYFWYSQGPLREQPGSAAPALGA
jgi:hypothetical protein